MKRESIRIKSQKPEQLKQLQNEDFTVKPGAKNKSIMKKFLAGIFIPLILILLTAGFFVVQNVRRSVTEMTNQNLETESNYAAAQAEQFFEHFLSGVECIAANRQMEDFARGVAPGSSLRINQNPNYPYVRKTLEKLVNTDKNTILACWFTDVDSSQFMQSDGAISDPGWDASTRPWYRSVTEKRPIITEPYVDTSTGKLVVTASAPVFDSNTQEPVAAVGFDFTLEQIGKVMGDFKVGEEGFVIFCSQDRQIISYPDSSYVKKNISESNLSANAVDAIRSGKPGLITYTMGGKKFHGNVSQVGDTGWIVLSGLPHSEFMAAENRITRIIFVSFLIGILLLCAIIVILTNGIVRPLKRLSVVTNKIAAGDLDVNVDIQSRDEIGSVASAMSGTVLRLKEYINYINEISDILEQIGHGNLVFELKYDYAGDFSKIKTALLHIRETLTGTLREIAAASDQVSEGSEQISSGAQALSAGAAEQASSIEELSATINELSGKVRGNAEAAGGVNRSALEVADELKKSDDYMNSMVAAMTEINDASMEIGHIVKAIEDIAFQTNILALNAAVEAARAGEAGKGFAVVADEVRNLAGKSAAASQDTTALIEKALKAIENGMHIANQTADALTGVVGKTRGMAEGIETISTACQEEAEAISQVTIGVDQISAVVQTNSATAEESAAASEELSGQARMLKELVGQFKLRE